MKPTTPRADEPHALVDLVDLLLRDGVMIQADIVITVADIPLVGVNARLALAGMATMTEYGFFEEWDDIQRRRAGRESARLRSEVGGAEKPSPATAREGKSRRTHPTPATSLPDENEDPS